MFSPELVEKARYLEQELGPCLLVVKCYDLLGERRAEIRQMASQVSRAEISRLAEMSQRGFGIGPMSEQFLRVIYAFQIAGESAQAMQSFKAFLAKVTPKIDSELRLSGLAALRLAVAAVIVGDRQSDLTDCLAPESFGAAIAHAWRSGSRQLLEPIADRLEDQIETAENEGQIAPWEEGWNYVLLRSLRDFLECKGN